MSTHFDRYILSTEIACLTGGVLGFGEALWLMESTGAPDRFSLLYGVILYGTIGRCIGIVAMFVLSIFKNSWLERYAHFLGALSVLLSIGNFVGFYQIRKVVYAEQMPPIHVLVGMEFLLLFASVFFLLPSIQTALTGFRLRILNILLAVVGLIGWQTGPQGTNDFGNTITGASAKEGTPNVVLFFIDTLRADHVGAYKEMNIRTPHMDSLAADGVLFEQSYAQASWTRPSGVSIFSGRIPSGHSTQIKAAAAPDEAVFFTEVLQNAHIRTAGLANNINLTATFHLNQGYDSFVYTEPEYPLMATESVFGLTLYKVLEKLSSRFSFSQDRKVETYYQPATKLFSLASEFLTNNGKTPWMLYLHLMEPHDPYFAHPVVDGGTEEYSGEAYGRKEHEHPDPKDTEHIKDLYRQEIEYLDVQLGKFISSLKEQNLYDNTMIVLVSDHGEEFHEHGGFWHGTTLYDEVLRVPLIIKLPKNTPNHIKTEELRGKRVPWQVRTLDIAPTITEMLGIPADPSWEGQNLLSEASVFALLNPSVPSEDCMARREHPLDRIAVAENNFEGNILSSIRMRGFKYILANKENNRNLAPEELYDVHGDVGEQTNLMASSASLCDTPMSTHSTTLKLVLGEVINTAMKTAAVSSGVELDEATIEKMRALGYMAGEE